MIKYCNNCGQAFNVNLSCDFFAARKFCSDRCRNSFYKRYTRELDKMLVTEKQCPVCGNWFKPNYNPDKQIYCSAKCRSIHNNAKHNPNPRKVLHCVVCGKILQGKRLKFCSDDCSRKFEAQHKPVPKIYICEVCGSSYQLKQGGSRCLCPDCYRESKVTPKPKPKPAPRIKSFDDYAREADECGLSYGKYKVALKLGKTYEQLKAEYQRQL